MSLNFFPNFLPSRTGGEQRSFFVLKALAEKFDIISVVPTYDNMRMEIVTLAPGLTEVRIPKSRMFSEVSAELRRKNIPIHQTAMAYALAGASQPEMLDYLRKLWPQIDGVILQHASAVAVADAVNLERKPTFYISHNCEFELAANAHIDSQDHEYAILMHQLEYRACLGADLVVPVTNEDREKFIHLFGTNRARVHVAGNGSVCRFDDETAFEAQVDAASALFLGSKWGPNLTAGKFICSTLAADCPDITFHICGNVCDDLANDNPPENVTLHGVLSDEQLKKLMAKTHIGLNPILDGAGSNVKLADYLAHGLRVVTTPKGVRGFEGDLENLHCCAPEDLPTMLQTLCNDGAPDAATRRSWQGAAALLWSWDKIGADLADRMEAVLSGAQETTKPVRRILVLNEFPITGRESGGEARIGGLLSEVPPNTEVVVASFGRGNFALHQLFDRVSCIELPSTTKQKTEVARANRYNYTSVDDVVYPQTVHWNPMFLAALETMVAHCDAVVLEHPFMWEVYRQLRSRAPVIFGSHNVEADMKLVTLDSHQRKHEFCGVIRKWEQELTLHAETILACSEQDAEVYRQWGAKKVEVLENGVTPLDAQISQGGFESVRKLYMRSEFDDLTADNAASVHQRLLGRVSSKTELAACASAIRAGGPALDDFLLGIVRSPENLNGPRVYVTGLMTDRKDRPFSAVFLGTSHRPNLSAAELLISYVAPACPDTDFLIVGKVGRSLQSKALPPNVFVSGFVSDALKTAAMLDCDLGLNPMTEGGGSNLKIPDYLVHGLDVISTYFGGRGFRFSPEEGLHLADICDFSEKINELWEARKPRSAECRRVRGTTIEDYYWSALSQRYYARIAEAAGFEKKRDVVLLKSELSIDPSVLSYEKAPLRMLGGQPGVHIATQCRPLPPPGEAPHYHDLSLRRLSCFEERREVYSNLVCLGRFGMFRKRLMSKGVSMPVAALLPQRPQDAVVFSRGFSAPLYNGVRVHRFLIDGAQLTLPIGCEKIVMRGYATSAMTIRIRAEDRTVFSGRVDRKFSLNIPLDGALVLDFEVTGQGGPASYSISLEDMTIDHGGLQHKLAMLQPDFLPRRRILDSVPQPLPLQEDSALHTLKDWAQGAAQLGGSVQACGDASFMNALKDQVPQISRYENVGAVAEDWAIGLMSNQRNRIGYRNKLNLGYAPFVIVAEELTSELVALIETSAARLRTRFPETKVVLFLPGSVTKTNSAKAFSSYFAKKELPVTCMASESEGEAMAVMAEAGAVLGHRLQSTQLERISRLADIFDFNLLLWGGHSNFDGRDRAVRTIDEIINAYWRRASEQGWQPSSRIDLIKQDKAGQSARSAQESGRVKVTQ